MSAGHEILPAGANVPPARDPRPYFSDMSAGHEILPAGANVPPARDPFLSWPGESAGPPLSSCVLTCILFERPRLSGT